MIRPHNAPAFTLIELLVVITIIVVLLAMLTPALDRAIYRAELTMCAANLKGVGSGALVYAVDHKRYYPDKAKTAPDRLYEHNSPAQDRRPILRPYISIHRGLLQDPLTDIAELDDTESTVWTVASLFFGFQYTSARGGAGMFKIGDRFAYTGPDDIPRRFRMLASDEDQIETGLSMALGPHPDTDGLMTNEVWYRQQTVTGSEDLGNAPGGSAQTLSKWLSRSTQAHGPIDINTVYDDASVAMWDKMTWNAGKPAEFGGDERFVAISNHAPGDTGSGDPGVYLNVPVR